MADVRGYVGGSEEVFVGLGGGNMVPCSFVPNFTDDPAAGALDVGEAMIVDPADGLRAGGSSGGAIVELTSHSNTLF